MVSEKRLAELGQRYNFYSEQAARLYLDDHLDEAHAAADQAIAAVRKLSRRRPDDEEVAAAYADICRNRAEIRTLLVANSSERRPAQLERWCAGGADDARKALELYARAGGRQFPTRIASIRLNLAELLAVQGRRTEARAQADAALADYRQHLATDHEYGATHLARALERFADLIGIGLPDSPPEAREARLSALTLYRPYAQPGTDLWEHRFSRGTIWWSTPTLERFGATAQAVASDVTGADRQAMLALLDAAEVEAAMVSHWFLMPGQLDRHHLTKATGILDELAARLEDGTPALAEDCRSAVPRIEYLQRHAWFSRVHALRPDVEAVADRPPPPPS